ncbi:glycosyltransferase family 39 protein [Niveibacterium sp. SC-1]|uniref:ArnT family glycosyltransferase n=1 Tax=Niveibacterium sp. SC-1 TaxID=3135646 RepID=UPI00311E765D
MAYAEPAHPPKFPLWAIWTLFLLYALPGLIDHDPWRGDDITHFGVVFEMYSGGDWLVPGIAGVPHPEYPPFYYWIATLLAKLLHWAMPIHNAARLASGLFTGIAIAALARTAQRLYRDRADRAAALLCLGTLGLVLHAHEFQPQLALFAGSALTFWGFAEFLIQPRRGAIIAGLAMGMAFLSTGFSAFLLLLPLWVLLPLFSRECRERRHYPALALGAGIAISIAVAWSLVLRSLRPEGFALWWASEMADITPHLYHFVRLGELLQLLGWFVWPLWPLAIWALWRHRRTLNEARFTLPLAAFVLASLLVVFTGPMRPAHTLPLLPPLVLLAAAGVQTLRRGAASALDWFGRMCFAGFGVFMWVAWYALHFGHPAPLARNIARVLPGFSPSISVTATVLAVLLSLCWIVMLVRPPRSPIRGSLSWGAGVTFLWGLTVALLLPAVNFDKGYREIANSVARQVEGYRPGCIIGTGMGPSQLAAMDYFAALRFAPSGSQQCQYMLSYRSSRDTAFAGQPGWEKIWEIERGRKRTAEAFALYKRPDFGNTALAGNGTPGNFPGSSPSAPYSLPMAAIAGAAAAGN